MQKCPCCSGKFYLECCGRFIDQKQIPKTPEELMRSRYTAFTQANITYLADTMRDPATSRFNFKEAEQWAKAVSWVRLEVHHSGIQSETEGTVSFTAYFVDGGLPQQMHENSVFHKMDGRWFYVDGNKDFAASRT